jgi:hypothetical protein
MSDTGHIPEPGTMAADPIAVSGFEPAFTRLYACMLTAGADCSAAAACLAQTGSAGTCTADALENGKCSGTVLSGCTADGYKFATDCAVDGEACGSYPALFAQFNGCETPCPAQLVCFGSDEEVCLNNALVRLDCQALDVPCANGSCVTGPPATCNPKTFTDHCDGTVVVLCDQEGTIERQDCSLSPTHRRCAANGLTAPACALTGEECMEIDTCVGDEVGYCHDGYDARVSCTAIGFAGCSNGSCVR